MTFEEGQELQRFRAWALGDRASNVNRATYAEWLVGEALRCLRPTDVRRDWEPWDLDYRGDVRIEVKASGCSQPYQSPGDKRSPPRFDVSGVLWEWDRETAAWHEHPSRRRVAHVYVFCLHRTDPVTGDSVRDKDEWTFWVVPTRTLNEKLGTQKSVGIGRLDELADRTDWDGIKAAVDACLPG